MKRLCRISDTYEFVKSGPRDLYERAKYQLILDWLAPFRPLKILNAGFGSGVLSFLLAADGHNVTGIDVSEECHRQVMRRVDELRDRGTYQWLSRCSFHVSSIESFRAPSHYDCVVATDVFEHVEDDNAVIGKTCSFVASGGIVVATVPAGPWLFGHHDRLIGHYRRYTKKQMREKLDRLIAVQTLRYFGFST
ncbi:MAG: class I SAM-dependent methyltransferase, partial [bacterium]